MMLCATLGMLLVQGRVEYWKWAGFEYAKSPLAPASEHVIGRFDITKVPTVPLAAAAPTYRIRAVVLKKTDCARTDFGISGCETKTLRDADIASAKVAIKCLPNVISYLSSGAVRVVIDSEFVDAPLLYGVTFGRGLPALALRKPTLRESMLSSWFRGVRCNEGSFQADDGLYRGPYSSHIVLTPSPEADEVGSANSLDEVPTSIICATEKPADRILYDLVSAFANQVDTVLKGDNFSRAGDARTLIRQIPAGMWTSICQPSLAAGAEVINWRMVSTAEKFVDPALTEDHELTSGVAVSVETPAAGVGVLRLSQEASQRSFSVPLPSATSDVLVPQGSKSFTFSVRTQSHVAFAIAFQGRDRTSCCNVGSCADPKSLPLAADGQWHRLAIDLRDIETQIGGPALRAEICSTRVASNYSQGAVAIDFREFAASPEAVSSRPPLDLDDPFVQAAAVVTIAAKGKPDPAVLIALNASEKVVRLNAILAFASLKDPNAIPKLADLSVTFDADIQQACIDALSFQGTEDSEQALREIVRSGVGEFIRAYAACSLGKTPSQDLALLVEPMVAFRTPAARLLAVQALARDQSEVVRRLRMVFLISPEPEVKLAVTLAISKPNPEETRKLMWSAVNEPSDAVRLASYAALTESENPDAQKEGLAAMHDDSYWVRLRYAQKYRSLDAVRKLLPKDPCRWIRELAEPKSGTTSPGLESVSPTMRLSPMESYGTNLARRSHR